MNIISLRLKIGEQELPTSNISYFEYITGIKQALPTGKIIMDDSGGRFFSEFRTPIGLPISVVLIGDEADQQIELEPLIVSSIMDQADYNDLLFFGGKIVINLVHPWVFYKDFTAHVYPPMNLSDLIKKVLEESTRGWEFTAKTFEKSTDSGKLPRYKYAESDYDFIINDLLPYTNVNGNPVYFYGNEKNEFYLSTFKNLFNEDPKAIINFGGNLQKLTDEIGEVKIGMPSAALISIGESDSNQSIYSQLKQFIYTEDLQTQNFIMGVQTPSVKAKGASGNSAGNILPVWFPMMAQTKATTSNIFLNRSFEDQFALAFTGSKSLDSMFKLVVSTNCLNDVISCGNTVYCLFPNQEQLGESSGTKEKKVHWADGKWVIEQIKLAMNTTDSEGKKTNLTLSSEFSLMRPTFIINKLRTTILEPYVLDNLAEVT